MSLNINSDYKNDSNSWIVKISGELDVSCADDLKKELDSNIDNKLSNVKIDMSNLQYIDSTGIGVIIGAMKKLRKEKKDISILNAKDNVKKIFKITGLDQIIRMEG
ncbi:MAG: Anti-sigma-B factor antagonist [Peptostreptococcus russellii]|uniref:Anti-sigma factor antagonist n=1 Tax=Peptostreptococcus russellii TaxID=215200 RepID=A0A2P7PZ84_9FIRM|nr:STAS domain-containing protein [Peptostreptococcus russellii]PSJ31021.1 anti-sigma factor antagonist [Peptostreptococcus russellii]